MTAAKQKKGRSKRKDGAASKKGKVQTGGYRDDKTLLLGKHYHRRDGRRGMEKTIQIPPLERKRRTR